MGRQVGSRPPKSPGMCGHALGRTCVNSYTTVAEGATIPLRLGFGDIGGVSGKYFANPSIRSRENGQVMER